MSWDSPPTPPVRGWLARHLGRLQQSLDTVGEQVRQAVASAIGRTMAEAIGEAVYEALRPCAGPAGPQPRSTSWYADCAAVRWPDRDEPEWRRQADASPWRDGYGHDEDDDRQREDSPPTDRASRTERWGQAVAAGLRAAAWWLRRHPDEVPLRAALAIGALVGLAVLAGHPGGLAGLIASALGLAYLLDLLRWASRLPGRDNTPATTGS